MAQLCINGRCQCTHQRAVIQLDDLITRLREVLLDDVIQCIQRGLHFLLIGRQAAVGRAFSEGIAIGAEIVPRHGAHISVPVSVLDVLIGKRRALAVRAFLFAVLATQPCGQTDATRHSSHAQDGSQHRVRCHKRDDIAQTAHDRCGHAGHPAGDVGQLGTCPTRCAQTGQDRAKALHRCPRFCRTGSNAVRKE